MSFALPLELAPMEARLCTEIPRDSGWQYEPKWDGFRCIAFRDGDAIRLQSKSGQPLERYFPEVVARLQALAARRFVLDGELVIDDDGALSFDDLLQRIHPAASRVAKLAQERPATYQLFDLLADERGETFLDTPLVGRRERLEAFAAHFIPLANPSLRLSPATCRYADVERWLSRVGGEFDGIVAKRLDAPYRSGERDAVVKFKTIRSADCVVGGYRLAASGSSVGSLLLGLYDADGKLDYVGFTSGYAAAEKRELLLRLQPLHAAVSFTGRTPGGPSRWNRGKPSAWQPVRPELVLEVAYDHVTAARFRHGTRPLRFRPDKLPRSCTLDQIAASKHVP